MSSIFIPYDDQKFVLKPNQWDGYTLIVPCISVGNVPQLTVDLLVNRFLKRDDPKLSKDPSRDLEFIGYIRSSNVRPFAGPDAYQINGSLLSTSIQVFVSDKKKLVVIQQRSPVYKEYRTGFYEEITKWLSSYRFETILLLSSSFDQFLDPESLDETQVPIMYLSNKDTEFESYLKEKLSLKPVPKVDPHTLKPDSNGKEHIPGSGSARSFLKYFSENRDKSTINIICLMLFCSEGDNRFHAFRLADKVADILNRSETVIMTNKLDPKKNDLKRKDEPLLERYDWEQPFSWRMMYGEEPPLEIY